MATADATIRIVAQDKTAAAFKKLDSRLDRTTKAFKQFAITAAAVVGASGLGRMISGTINAADQIQKLSMRLGVGAQALSEYKHVADISGVSFETLTMGLQRMTRRVAEAASGMGEARGALKELNLNAVELNKLPLDQKFEVIADALSGLKSDADRVRLAMKLFDSEGVALIQTMEGGSASIRALREEAQRLNIAFSQEQVDAAARAKDEMTRLGAVFTGIKNQLVVGFIPTLTELTTVLSEYVPKGIDLAASAFNTLKQVIDTIIQYTFIGWMQAQIAFNKSIQFLVDNLYSAVEAISGFQERIGQTFIDLTGLSDRLFEYSESLAASNNKMQFTIDTLKDFNGEAKSTGETVVILGEKIEDVVTVMDDLSKPIADVETELTDAEKAMLAFKESINKTQLDSDLLIDKMELLDELFRDGKISGEVYEKTLRGLGDAFGDAAEDGVALVEVVEDTQTVFEELVDNIDGSWTQMWKDLFGGGKTEDVLKGFLDRIKKMFLDTLAEIVAAWTKNKIIEMITGGVGGGSGGASLLGTLLGGLKGTASSGVLSQTVGSAINPAFSSTSGATALGHLMTSGGKIASTITSSVTKAVGSIFGGGATAATGASSLGVSLHGATAASAGTAAAGAGMSALGFALPLAILGFGLFRSQKIKRMMKKKYRELMSDPSITANLADHALFEHIQVLGDQAGQTWVQIGDTASRVLDELTTRSMGVMKLGFREMKDEFGNVLVTANDFSKLMDTLERQKPFLKQADDLVKLHGEMGLAKEGIDLINVELFEADAAFQQMGKAGIDAIMKIDTRSTAYATMMQKGFVTAVQTAKMGIGEFGTVSAEVFDTIVQGVQAASGEMQSLAQAADAAKAKAEAAITHEQRIKGFQHGGSFLVGGGGGTDSQRVSFMATPGERVTVETPNQSKASGSDGGGVVKELRALRHDLASVVAKPIVGAVTRGQLAMAGGARH